MSDETLLPQTATPLVKAMEAVEERLHGLPVGAITKDPYLVPSELLDHLGWEVSADLWDGAWPDDFKRDVIAASEELHRFKGTPWAIKRVLEVFGYSYALREWWQEDPEGEAGTFAIRIFPFGEGARDVVDYSPASLKRLIRLVRSVSPVSRRFDLELGLEATSTVSIGSIGTFAVRLEVHPLVASELEMQTNLTMAGTARSTARLELN